VPIAAPSANLAGRPSPTTAEHVIKDLGQKIDIIIDGGSTKIGLESTVIDLTIKVPVILRPGRVTFEELQKVLGVVKVHPIAKAKRKMKKLVVRSPGMKYRHYAPSADLILIEDDVKNRSRKIQGLVRKYKKERKRVGILITKEMKLKICADSIKIVGTRKNLRTVAKRLFEALREFDEEGVDVIIAEGVKDKDMGLAIMNRLRKAASRIISQ
jgi:L-threonylcarbamoyladenylate synthase